jgi:hypothetical protein
MTQTTQIKIEEQILKTSKLFFTDGKTAAFVGHPREAHYPENAFAGTWEVYFKDLISYDDFLARFAQPLRSTWGAGWDCHHETIERNKGRKLFTDEQVKKLSQRFAELAE